MGHPIQVSKIIKQKSIKPVKEPSGIVSTILYTVILPNDLTLKIRNNNDKYYLY